jgi:hypothetical protein
VPLIEVIIVDDLFVDDDDNINVQSKVSLAKLLTLTYSTQPSHWPT